MARALAQQLTGRHAGAPDQLDQQRAGGRGFQVLDYMRLYASIAEVQNGGFRRPALPRLSDILPGR